mmetsp:Transcript_14205/g.24144  ORF Transcript_14205/g.24144 Transcript_14205/m.24144 type:complete len:206 (-) Transcript_14205:1015-1632(-)
MTQKVVFLVSQKRHQLPKVILSTTCKFYILPRHRQERIRVPPNLLADTSLRRPHVFWMLLIYLTTTTSTCFLGLIRMCWPLLFHKLSISGMPRLDRSMSFAMLKVRDLMLTSLVSLGFKRVAVTLLSVHRGERQCSGTYMRRNNFVRWMGTPTVLEPYLGTATFSPVVEGTISSSTMMFVSPSTRLQPSPATRKKFVGLPGLLMA